MIEAEYEDLHDGGDKLDLADTDSLPWLESDEDDEDAGGVDMMQIITFVAGLLALGAVLIGGVWFFSNRVANSEAEPDGSVIAAPEGPVKQRPDDPGGKEFAGTGNVAPVVGEGGSRPAVVAEAPAVQLPPLPGGTPGAKPMPVPSGSTVKPAPAATPSASAGGNAAAAQATGGVGVQLAAYGTRARAEQGWSEVSRRTDKLAGVKYRIVEGKVDIGTVYRLQAVAGSRAEADRLCGALKADGIDCQVK